GAAAATLDRGEFYETILTTASEITADQPVLVVQYSNGSQFDGVEPADPSMMIVPAPTPWLRDYQITTPTLGLPPHYLNRIVPDAAVGAVTKDGALLDPGLFTPIGTTGYAGAQIEVTEGGHHLSAPQPFGRFIYGFGHDDAYSFPGGLNFAGPAQLAGV